jgi:hypothetical protein
MLVGLWRDIAGWERQTGPKEVFFHLLFKDLVGLVGAKCQAIFIHDHLEMLFEHSPAFLGNILVDLLTKRVIERWLVESRQLPLQFDTFNHTFRHVDLLLQFMIDASIASIAATPIAVRATLGRNDRLLTDWDTRFNPYDGYFFFGFVAVFLADF